MVMRNARHQCSSIFQRNFTEDSFIGQCNIDIPDEVLQGQNYQHWYPLIGRESNINENQGDILVIMSLMVRNTIRERTHSIVHSLDNAD